MRDSNFTEDDLAALAELIDEKTSESVKDDLEPLTPCEAVEKYFEARDGELGPSTVNSYKSSLGFFTRWCAEESIENVNDLTGKTLHNYRVWRREEAPVTVDRLSKKSEKTQQDILRKFIEILEGLDAVPTGLHEKVQSPTLKEGEDVRDEMLATDAARGIMDWLGKYEYASADHVVWTLLTSTGMRTGALHSLDVDDFHGGGDDPYLDLHHRPKTGTELKNDERSERTVYIPRETATVIEDYLEDVRPDVTDDYGRRPLLASMHGRLATSTIRIYVYKWTRPCKYLGSCPHDRDPDGPGGCVAAGRACDASKCPSSLSGHPVRRGYITQELRSEVPMAVVSARCDVSEDVIEKHYDRRTSEEKMQARKKLMELAHSVRPGYAQA